MPMLYKSNHWIITLNPQGKYFYPQITRIFTNSEKTTQKFHKTLVFITLSTQLPLPTLIKAIVGKPDVQEDDGLSGIDKAY